MRRLSNCLYHLSWGRVRLVGFVPLLAIAIASLLLEGCSNWNVNDEKTPTVTGPTWNAAIYASEAESIVDKLATLAQVADSGTHQQYEKAFAPIDSEWSAFDARWRKVILSLPREEQPNSYFDLLGQVAIWKTHQLSLQSDELLVKEISSATARNPKAKRLYGTVDDIVFARKQELERMLRDLEKLRKLIRSGE